MYTVTFCIAGIRGATHDVDSLGMARNLIRYVTSTHSARVVAHVHDPTTGRLVWEVTN